MPRKKQDAAEPGGATKHLRAYGDIVEMVAWIVRIEGTSSAQLVDPLLRPQIAARYKLIEPLVEQIKRAEAAAKKRAGGC